MYGSGSNSTTLMNKHIFLSRLMWLFLTFWKNKKMVRQICTFIVQDCVINPLYILVSLDSDIFELLVCGRYWCIIGWPRFKGTVSRDWDELFVVWMEIALFRDESLIIYIPIYCFLVFNFEFYFLQRYCTKIASLSAIGATLLQCAEGC
jgi:hypothetical protein